MKIINLFLIIVLSVAIISCRGEKKSESTNTEKAEKTVEEFIEDITIEVNENFSSKFKPIEAASLDVTINEGSMAKYTTEYAKIDINKNDAWVEFNKAIGDNLSIPKECWDARPTTIDGLTDGVLIDAYSFKKGDEAKLGFMGFFNVSIEENQKIVVVEFSQEGTQYCSQVPYKYGVGARLMMKVSKSKRNAKLNTPQQITASVIYGRAEVTYSLKTFGIVGPGVSRLSKTGSLSEDTYQEFLESISNLIVDMYKKDSDFIITPQPLLLKRIQG